MALSESIINAINDFKNTFTDEQNTALGNYIDINVNYLMNGINTSINSIINKTNTDGTMYYKQDTNHTLLDLNYFDRDGNNDNTITNITDINNVVYKDETSNIDNIDIYVTGVDTTYYKKSNNEIKSKIIITYVNDLNKAIFNYNDAIKSFNDLYPKYIGDNLNSYIDTCKYNYKNIYVYDKYIQYLNNTTLNTVTNNYYGNITDDDILNLRDKINDFKIVNNIENETTGEIITDYNYIKFEEVTTSIADFNNVVAKCNDLTVLSAIQTILNIFIDRLNKGIIEYIKTEINDDNTTTIIDIYTGIDINRKQSIVSDKFKYLTSMDNTQEIINVIEKEKTTLSDEIDETLTNIIDVTNLVKDNYEIVLNKNDILTIEKEKVDLNNGESNSISNIKIYNSVLKLLDNMNTNIQYIKNFLDPTGTTMPSVGELARVLYNAFMDNDSNIPVITNTTNKNTVETDINETSDINDN